MVSDKLKTENWRSVKTILTEPSKFIEEVNHTGKPCVSYAYKKYGCFENWQIALSKLTNMPVEHKVFNELIIMNREVKPYFDIEYYSEQFDYQQEEVILAVKSALVSIFKEKWDFLLLPKDICIAQCHRQTRNGFKNSFHVIISTNNPMVVFRNNNEASGLAHLLREKIIDKFDPSIIDTGVYKKVQNFRLLNHTKEGEDTPLSKVTLDRDDLDFLVTNINHNNKLVLKTEEQTDSLWKNMMKLKGFDNNINAEDKITIVTEMCKTIHPTCFFEKIDNHGFLQFNYSDRSEKCFTEHYHEKIGFFAFIKDKQVFIGCHSGRCVESVNEKDVKTIKIIGKIDEETEEKEIRPVTHEEEFEIDYPFITKCIFDKSFGIARLFKKLYMNPTRLKYTTERKIYFWDGKLWTEDESMFLDSLLVNTVVKILRRFLNSFFDEVEDICVIEPDHNDDIEKSRKTIVSTTQIIINKLLDGISLKQILNFVIPDITDKYFLKNKDVHPYFLACNNGLVDLRNGLLRDFLPSDNVTKCLEVKYNKDSDSSVFEKFVRDIVNNDEHMYDYLRWAIGYSLQGKPNRKIYFILWGERGYNGKSLLLNTISEILNGYCKNMDASVVLLSPKKTAGSHSSELLHLENVRMGILSDLKENDAINDGQIKQITGATDKISAREIFGKQKEFTPIFVPFISTNHKPSINSSDEGLFDRTMIIPFEISFVENPSSKWERKGDPDLYDKFKKNKEGILKWLIDCGMFYNQNIEFPIPEKIIKTKEEYKREMNVHKKFLEDTYIKSDDPEDIVTEISIFEEFKIYCQTNNYKDARKERSKVITELAKCLDFKKMNNKYEFVNIKRKEVEERNDFR